MEKRRVFNSIYIWRVVYCVLITRLHSTWDNRYYLGCEFFFIVSGWLLAKRSLSQSEDPGKYVLERIRKLYPYYLVGFVLGMITHEHSIHPRYWILRWNELMGLVGLGYIGPSEKIQYNGPGWFVSALLLTSFCLYLIINKWGENYIKYIAPVVSLFLYATRFRNNPEVTNYSLNFDIGYFCIWARPFAAMNLGLIAYLLTNWIHNKIKSQRASKNNDIERVVLY